MTTKTTKPRCGLCGQHMPTLRDLLHHVGLRHPRAWRSDVMCPPSPALALPVASRVRALRRLLPLWVAADGEIEEREGEMCRWDSECMAAVGGYVAERARERLGRTMARLRLRPVDVKAALEAYARAELPYVADPLVGPPAALDDLQLWTYFLED